MGGMITSLTNDETILPNAAPDDETNRHVEDVAFHGELFELFEHAHACVSTALMRPSKCSAGVPASSSRNANAQDAPVDVAGAPAPVNSLIRNEHGKWVSPPIWQAPGLSS